MKVSTSDVQSNISIQVVHGIEQIDAGEWNALSAGRPFQSHTWYRFGEQAMADCEPVYLLAYQDEKLVGRASFWVTPNEPLPQYAGVWRVPLKFLLKKWPLFICRSPLSYTTGLVTDSSSVDRDVIFSLLIDAAMQQASLRKCSFLIFDYLGKAEKQNWPPGFSVMEAPTPGTVMENHWTGFDDYLAQGNKKDRQHYKRTVRESEKLKIEVHRSARVDNVDELLPLIRNMERRHGAPSNPWVGNMLRSIEMVDGTLLTVTAEDKLVGCGLLLEDNNAQMTSALGRSQDLPYVYLMLVYESIRMALEHRVQLLRWGSGAYEIKQKLGFELEDNGMFVFAPVPPFLRKISHWFT